MVPSNAQEGSDNRIMLALVDEWRQLRLPAKTANKE